MNSVYAIHSMAADPLFPWLLFSDDPRGRAGKKKKMKEMREKDVEKEGEGAELFGREVKGYDAPSRRNPAEVSAEQSTTDPRGRFTFKQHIRSDRDKNKSQDWIIN